MNSLIILAALVAVAAAHPGLVSPQSNVRFAYGASPLGLGYAGLGYGAVSPVGLPLQAGLPYYGSNVVRVASVPAPLTYAAPVAVPAAYSVVSAPKVEVIPEAVEQYGYRIAY